MKDRGGRFLSALKDEVSTPKIDEIVKFSNQFKAVIHILGFRCFFFFAYKYLYTCLAGTPAQPYSHKG